MWEYMLLKETEEKKIVPKLNELANENWEVVQYSTMFKPSGVNHFFLLKRQK